MRFAERVAASLLNAIGLPELNPQPGRLRKTGIAPRAGAEAVGAYRNAHNRLTHPLFDTRFRRHIEAAYRYMWQLWQNGETTRLAACRAERHRIGTRVTAVVLRTFAVRRIVSRGCKSMALTLSEALKRASTTYKDGKFSEVERLCHAILAAK